MLSQTIPLNDRFRLGAAGQIIESRRAANDPGCVKSQSNFVVMGWSYTNDTGAVSLVLPGTTCQLIRAYRGCLCPTVFSESDFLHGLGRFLPVATLLSDRPLLGESRHSSKEFICSVRPSLNDRSRLRAALQKSARPAS